MSTGRPSFGPSMAAKSSTELVPAEAPAISTWWVGWRVSPSVSRSKGVDVREGRVDVERGGRSGVSCGQQHS